MLGAMLCLSIVVTPSADYAQPALLADADAFAKNPAGLVLDVRTKQQYLAGHIPGAVWVNAAAWGKAFTPNASAIEWSKRLGDAGIEIGKPVIICGGDDVRDPCRIWWILRYWGVPDVKMLNGGWSAWQAAGGKVAKEETHPEARNAQRSRLKRIVLPRRIQIAQSAQRHGSSNPRRAVDRGVLWRHCDRKAQRLDSRRHSSRMERVHRFQNEEIQVAGGVPAALPKPQDRSEQTEHHILSNGRPSIGNGFRSRIDGRQASPKLLPELVRMGQRPQHADRQSGRQIR